MKRMKHRKRFKAIIIDRKTLTIAVACFAIGGILGCTFLFSKTAARVSAQSSKADDIYKAVLENELPLEKDNKHINILRAVFGFDILKPESILLAAPIFEMPDIDYPEESTQMTATPETPPPSPTAQPQMKIEDTSISKGMSISNATTYNVNADALANETPDFTLTGSGAEVLIVHTHTTESYTEEGKNTYTSSDSDRSTDSNKNVIQVGNKICEVLNNSGINAIHDPTVHDYPSYNGAYGRSLSTVERVMRDNPGIKVVLDVHRDAMVRADGTKLKVTADINGKKAAQVMIVIGTDGGGLNHPYWQSNMKFAAKIQKKANEMYPSLMRPMNLREERFNQHTTKGSLILEVGSNGNTLGEAVFGGECIANVIAEVLKNQ